MEIIKAKRYKPVPKRIKGKRNFRDNHNICPHCLSTLKVNDENILECTGDKLQFWLKDFEKYDDMDLINKNIYNEKLSNKEQFLSLYSNWKGGNLICEYSNKMIIPNLIYKQEIADPMFVGKIERSLGRELTEEEKCGDKQIYKIGERFTDYFEVGSATVLIPKINFPDDF